MPAYLLIWNPKHYPWNELAEDIQKLENSKTGIISGRWSTGRRKNIQTGDRLFLMQLGKEPRGIVASGVATSTVFEDLSWNEENPDRIDRYVNLNFDVLLDADKGHVLALEKLKSHPILGQHHWEQQISGTLIPESVQIELELLWEQYLIQKRKKVDAVNSLAEEIDSTQQYREGATRQITVNAYERNPHARQLCIEKRGLNCIICGFNFQKIYGDIGEGFIHVHHLKPLSELKNTTAVDPQNDLVPVCPNCHAMIHRKKPPYTIEEMQGKFNFIHTKY